MSFTQPRFPESLMRYKRAAALLTEGDTRPAMQQVQEVLGLEPHWLPAQQLKALVLMRQNQFAEAEQLLRQVLNRSPADIDVLTNLGIVCFQQERLTEAETLLRQALQTNPHKLEVNLNLALLYTQQYRFAQALSVLQTCAGQHSRASLLHNAFGHCYSKAGNFHKAITHYQQALQLDPADLKTVSSMLTCHPYLEDFNQATFLQLSRSSMQPVAEKISPRSNWLNTPDPDRRLRIGFVSADFQHHPVGFFLAPVLTAMQRNDVHLTAYHTMEFREDEIQQQLKTAMDRWRIVAGISDSSLAKLVEQDEIDILIDLAGHTSNHRLGMFALKPAPVQASWLGYYATTGLPTMDYLLCDATSVPPAESSGYSETLCYLPHSRLPLFKPPQVNTSPLPALQNNSPFTFGCFQNIDKINAGVLKVWNEILQACPNSRLRIQTRSLTHPELRTAFIAKLQHAGIDDSKCLLLPEAPLADYLQAHAQVDMILDTFPYPGGTTTNFALWQGVPTLTLACPGMLGRQGQMLMQAAGLPDWVCHTIDTYKEKAIWYGSQNAKALRSLARVRKALQTSLPQQPAADIPQFATHLKQAIRQMWQQYCKTYAAEQQPA